MTAGGGSQSYVEKKVHFQEKVTEKKMVKTSYKTPRVKAKHLIDIDTSRSQAMKKIKTTLRDDNGKPNVHSMEDNDGQKILDQQKVKKIFGAFNKTGKVGTKDAVLPKVQRNKKLKEKTMEKWQLVSFPEKVKMDMIKLANLAMKQSTNAKNEASDIMTSYGLVDVDRMNLPTFGFQKSKSLNEQGNYETLDVLLSIEEEKRKRSQQHVHTELEKIQKRIRKTLEDFDMGSDTEEDDYAKKFPPINTFDVNSERKKMQDRNLVIDCLDIFEEKALVRKQYLTEMMLWFKDHCNMCSDMVTPEELKDIMLTTQELHQVISKSLKAFIENAEEVVEKGKLLLAETSKIIEERRSQMAKKTRKERIMVFDDKALLSDHLKWESAAKTILSVFEDSHKMIKNFMFKNAIRLCQKQFDYMMEACDKQLKDLEDKKKHCFDLQGKLNSSKIQCDKLNREIEDQKKKFNKQSKDLFDTKEFVAKLDVQVQQLKKEVIELNSKITFLKKELNVKNRTPTPPPTPPPPPEPEKIYVKVVDSSTELKLREVETELETTKQEVERLLAELNEVKKQFQEEQRKTNDLIERIIELENEAAVEPPPPEPPVYDTRRLSDVDKDVNYYRTLMTGMKNDFEVEMEKVKSHVRKEKTRGEANLKKMECLHRDQLTYIHKDTLRMLRVIMHFREHMLTCLEKENLIDQAQALYDLGDIIKDKLSPDPKEMLATIVGTVLDYMNKMEGILSNSFLAMRVLMKYQIDKQVEAEIQQRMEVKEVQKTAKEIKGTKKNVKCLAKSLKKARNKLKKARNDISDFSSDGKYLDLLSRYNQMMKLYKNMQKEMEVLQSDFHDTMHKKLEEKEAMVISQIKMEIKQKKALAEEQLKMTLEDQRRNLKTLRMAYEQNKISKDLHLVATAMIQKTIEIPQLKLKTLFEQYITYRTIKDSKERVKRVLKDESADLSIDTREEMKNYIQTMDGKFKHSMEKWKDEMRNLDNEKHNLQKRIYSLFSEVLVDSGVLLVHPLLRDKNKSTQIIQAASQIDRSRVKDILFRKKKRCKEILSLPDEILGKGINLERGDNSFWTSKKLKQPNDVAANIVLPHMLTYDINKPKIDASRALHRRRTMYTLGRTESFNISPRNCVQFIRDIPPQEIELKPVVDISSL